MRTMIIGHWTRHRLGHSYQRLREIIVEWGRNCYYSILNTICFNRDHYTDKTLQIMMGEEEMVVGDQQVLGVVVRMVKINLELI